MWSLSLIVNAKMVRLVLRPEEVVAHGKEIPRLLSSRYATWVISSSIYRVSNISSLDLSIPIGVVPTEGVEISEPGKGFYYKDDNGVFQREAQLEIADQEDYLSAIQVWILAFWCSNERKSNE